MDDPIINQQFRILIDEIHKHEQEDHHGERCSTERANLVAYLAHTLHLREDEWKEAIHLWVRYEEGHRATTRD